MKFKIGQTRHDGTEEPVQMSYIPTIHKNEVLRWYLEFEPSASIVNENDSSDYDRRIPWTKSDFW